MRSNVRNLEVRQTYELVEAYLNRTIARCKKGKVEKLRKLESMNGIFSLHGPIHGLNTLSGDQIKDLILLDENSITMAEEALANIKLIKAYARQAPHHTRSKVKAIMIDKLLMNTKVQLKRLSFPAELIPEGAVYPYE